MYQIEECCEPEPTNPPNSTNTPTPSSSCTLSLNGPYNVEIGRRVTATADVRTETNGDVDEVFFSFPNANTASFGAGVITYTDTTASPGTRSYGAAIEGVAAGSVTLTAEGRMVSEGATCEATATVNVSAVPPSVGWFQAVGGDVIAGNGAGDVISLTIPATCALPICTPVLIKDNVTPNGFSGVPSAGGSSVSVGPSGGYSASGWNVTNGPFLGLEGYSYDYFTRKIPDGCTPQNISGSSVNLASGGATGGACGSYYWFKKDSGTLTLTSPVNLLDRKVIVFSAGNVTISGDITLNNGVGAFYLFSGGNIAVAPAVGDAPATSPTPDIEGVLFPKGSYWRGWGVFKSPHSLQFQSIFSSPRGSWL
jgi:hypothetical protein